MKIESTPSTDFPLEGCQTAFVRAALCTTFLFLFAAPARAAESQVLQGHVPAVVSHLQPVERLARGRRLNLA